MNPSTPDKKCPTCAKDKAILPGSIHMLGTLEHPAPHHPSPEKEVSQEKSYIDQVVENARARFMTESRTCASGFEYHLDQNVFEDFLRSALENQATREGLLPKMHLPVVQDSMKHGWNQALSTVEEIVRGMKETENLQQMSTEGSKARQKNQILEEVTRRLVELKEKK